MVEEPRRGYGAACLQGIAALRDDPPDVVLFLDADGSDDPAEAVAVLAPILDGAADLVVGSRVLGEREPGALTPHARFGNWLATRLLAGLYGARYTDLGPFRAIRYPALLRLGMKDRDFGWTVEMQIRALQLGAHGRSGLRPVLRDHVLGAERLPVERFGQVVVREIVLRVEFDGLLQRLDRLVVTISRARAF